MPGMYGRKPRRGRRIASNDIHATLVLDETLMGEVGFVSRDIWNELYGGITAEEDDGAMPITHVALSPSPIPAPTSCASPWIVIPTTIPPLNSSQFPTIPLSTILLPAGGAPHPLWEAFANQPSLRAENGIKFPIQLTATTPITLSTVVVGFFSTGEEGLFDEETIEEMITKGLDDMRVVHTGDVVRVQWMSVLARVRLCEPVDQGILNEDTKVIVVKESKGRKTGGETVDDGPLANGIELNGVDDSDSDEDVVSQGDEDDENNVELPGVSTFMDISTTLGTPAIATPLRNGPAGSVSGLSDGAPKVVKFTAKALSQKIPTPLLLPTPSGADDSEARVFVRVNELMGLGCFSGDWVGIASDHGLFGDRLPNGNRAWRPVKVYSLPDLYAGKEKVKALMKGSVYMSPLLYANLGSPTSVVLTKSPFTSPSAIHQGALLSPVATAPPGSASQQVPPTAKEVTLLRISTPISTDRALQPSLLAGLKTYFETSRKMVKVGDLIPVLIDESLGRNLFSPASLLPADAADTEQVPGAGDELLYGSASGGAGIGVNNTGKLSAAWFRVGTIVPADDQQHHIPSSPTNGHHTNGTTTSSTHQWGGIAIVDPGSTRMVQAGSEKGRIPPTLNSPWEYYLNIVPPPIPNIPPPIHPALELPNTYVSPVHRRLRELIAAATSPRSIKLNLAPLAVLLTSAQRSIGKRTLAHRAAADVGVHIFHIDVYDIIGEGGQASDVKTEAYLRARAERAASCGVENCVLLLSHVEAFSADRMAEALKDIVADMRIVIATTTDVDKVPEPVRNIFTHELDVGAPDEGERTGLLRQITQERGVRLAREIDLSTIALKTAALVAGDLVDVVERAMTACSERMEALAREMEGVSVRDIQLAGGDASCLNKMDFEAAVDAARKNFADSIGAPKIPNVSWDDVGGLANVKSAVMETIQLPLERPELFAKGMKKRSGILFYGPPGTGKTLLAKAIATEFSLNFFSVKGPELLNMYIGESEANVRRVFQRARDARPCVVFFDELDSVAPKRGNQGDSGGVMDRIVSQLLAELDGMSEGKEGSGGVFVIGATNRPDLLDPALLRPGRFDKMLFLGVSDTHEKQLTILEALTRKFTLHHSLSLAKIADTLPFTYTGADLYALCSDAMLKAITRQAAKVDQKIREMENPVSTAYFFDHLATDEDVSVAVTEEDFLEAKRELIGSVSQKELEHYDRVRQMFETVEEAKDEKGKGKGKAVESGFGDVGGEEGLY
ncbi:peroxisomal assembly protein [Orbilia brochopaga]|uniref:Peroxisomal ATPase PEX6 n=1 Tax=Orbilia brochopaga TaxID=3140254 RepID=A0AAV9UFG5_9PEZI